MGMGEGPFAAVTLLEYGGLQPILRVVIKTVGFMGGRRAVGGVFATRRFPRHPLY